MAIFRTPETIQSYVTCVETSDQKKLLDEELVQELEEWRVVKNRFPYDKVCAYHHLAVFKGEILYPLEKFEQEIMVNLDYEYDLVLYNFPRNQSVLDEKHIHLIKLKWR